MLLSSRGTRDLTGSYKCQADSSSVGMAGAFQNKFYAIKEKIQIFASFN